MREFIPQEYLPGLVTRGYEDDYEIDVYLFWHSVRPYVVLPADPSDAFYETPLIPEDHETGGFERDTVEFPPMSPTYSMTSDFVFPDRGARNNDISAIGYSAFFKTGLFSTSSSLTRHLDRIVRKLRGGIRKTRSRFTR
ncbi:hypothetical protein A0H81_03677 [Grifola frondosa]|uniref:Uncharacterized protein n=1 Tax=Grifola frondosa TaxID=5627 RepID=A0A1C7MJ49_GRIFR|nr:hypothetical protein A0H81_03677 [Grifola frondosa]